MGAVRRVRVVVSGRVQGVFFRAGCAEEARRRGVAGSVSNRPDGRVEAAFEGDDADVEAMIDWCRRGTDWAVVDSVEVTEEPPEGATKFDVER
jgi:acylphosphatase